MVFVVSLVNLLYFHNISDNHFLQNIITHYIFHFLQKKNTKVLVPVTKDLIFLDECVVWYGGGAYQWPLAGT